MAVPKEQQTWATLQCAIVQIFNHDASSLSFEELYKSAYQLVLHKHGELLYTGISDTLSKHLNGVASVVVDTVDSELLQVLLQHWEDHKLTNGMVGDVVMYMDRTYAMQNAKPSIYHMGLYAFREIVIHHQSIRERIQSLFLLNVYNEREGQLVDKATLRAMTAMFIELGVYHDVLEIPFLTSSREYYKSVTNDCLARSTVSEYLQKAHGWLANELARVSNYMDVATEKHLMDICEHEIISEHVAQLVTGGAMSMMCDIKLDDLARMYSLFARIPPTLTVLNNIMCTTVEALGLSLAKNTEYEKKPVLYVEALLATFAKYESIVTVAFEDDIQFKKSLIVAFQSIVNVDTRCAQSLSIYIDKLLR